jgi:hypothetical protein
MRELQEAHLIMWPANKLQPDWQPILCEASRRRDRR